MFVQKKLHKADKNVSFENRTESDNNVEDESFSVLVVDNETDFSNKVLRIVTPYDKFESLIDKNDDQPEVFVPTDMHHYDEEDYRDHRQLAYPHMHQPLKSMEPRVLMEIKRKIKANKREERLISSIAQPTLIIDNIASIPAPSFKEIPSRKKKRRKRKRSKKHEPFRPTLSKLSEESSSPLHTVITENAEDCGLVLEELSEVMRSMQEAPHRITPAARMSFLDEIASEDLPLGFLDITHRSHTVRQHSLPFFENLDNKDAVENIILSQSVLDLKNQNNPLKSPFIHGYGLSTTTSDVVASTNPTSPHHTQDPMIMPSTCNFKIGSIDSVDESQQDIFNVDINTICQRSISYPASSSSIGADVFHSTPHRHHRHKEHYDKRDLEKRTFSGQDMRSLWKTKDIDEVDEHEAALGNEIIEDMRDHRFFDIPAMNRPRIHNKYIRSNERLLHRSQSVTHSEIKKKYQPYSENTKKCIEHENDSCKVNGYTKSQQDLIFQSYNYPVDWNSINKRSGDPSPLFVEMDILKPHKYWREISRWVQYEQCYNELSDTFGRAHSSPLKFTSFTQFRVLLENAIFMPHVIAETLEEAINQLTEELLLAQLFSEPRDSISVKEVFKWRHLHAGEKFANEDHNLQQPFDSMKNMSARPNNNLGLRLINTTPDNLENGIFTHSLSDCVTKISFEHVDSKCMECNVNHKYGQHTNFPSMIKMLKNSIPILRHSKVHKSDLEGHLPPTTEGVTVHVGALDSLKKPFLAIIRFKNPIFMDRVMELNIPIRFLIVCLGPPGKVEYEELGRIISSMLIDKTFCKLMYRAADKCEIIEGLYGYLDTCFVLSYSGPRPTRNMHTMVDHISEFVRGENTPSPQNRGYSESDVIPNNAKRIVRYHSKDLDETAQLLHYEDGLNHFTSIDHGYRERGSIVRGDSVRYESGLWDDGCVENIIYEQPEYELSSSKELKCNNHENDYNVQFPSARKSVDRVINSDSKKQSSIQVQMCIAIFFFLFRLLRLDFIKYKERFISDFKDAFLKENIVIVLCGLIYLYFVCLSPALTFGVLLEDQVSKDFNVQLVLICNGVLTIIFALFGGNPLMVIGLTGPLFLMETVIAKMAVDFNLSITLYRFLVAVYVSVIGLISVAVNITWVMQKVRRSVEEIFNGFVGLYFIFKAVLTILRIFSISQPKPLNPVANYTINPEPTINNHIAIGFASLVLAYSMYQICMVLNSVNRSRFFTRKFRKMVDYFNVAIGILILSFLNVVIINMFGIYLPTLKAVTITKTWINFPDLFLLHDNVPFVAHSVAFLLALALISMIFTETAIAGITATKADKKLIKASLFAQDQIMCLCVIPLICGVCGWPFLSGAAVRSSSMVMAMTKWDQKVIPGVKHKILSVVEQRVTMIVVGSLVLATASFESILAHIPTSAMFGMFLYMGVKGVRDLVVTRRFVTMFKRRKYWKDHEYLLDIPPNVLKAFEILQLVMIIIMFSMNCITEFYGISWPSFLIPVVLFSYAISREVFLPRMKWFAPHLDKLDPRHYVVMASIFISKNERQFSLDKDAVLMSTASPIKGRHMAEDIVTNTGTDYALGDSTNTSADEWSSSSNSYHDS